MGICGDTDLVETLESIIYIYSSSCPESVPTVKMPSSRKVLCSCGCEQILSPNQARNHLNGCRPVRLQAALYEQNSWLERVRSTNRIGLNQRKVKATSSSNASTGARRSRATQSDGNASTNEMDVPDVAPAMSVGSSNASQCVIQASIHGSGLDSEESNHNGMGMDISGTAATPALPLRSSNVLPCVVQAPIPGNDLDSEESNSNGMVIDEMDASGTGATPALLVGSSNAPPCVIQASNFGNRQKVITMGCRLRTILRPASCSLLLVLQKWCNVDGQTPGAILKLSWRKLKKTLAISLQ